MLETRTVVAFHGANKLAEGDLQSVALETKRQLGEDAGHALFFQNATGEQFDVDLSGELDDVRQRFETLARGRGRPRLGVVAREVTLLPRHWDWLATQPGGASVALRRLVEDARKTYAERDRVRLAREAAYRFMSALAGNLPGFEEASRALFAGDRSKFEAESATWPADLRTHALALAADTWV